MLAYTLIYEPGPRNWSAYVPDLPGCIATGMDRAETERRIREAIEFHIQGMRLATNPSGGCGHRHRQPDSLRLSKH